MNNKDNELEENITDKQIKAVRKQFSKLRADIDKEEAKAIGTVKVEGVKMGIPATPKQVNKDNKEWRKRLSEKWWNYWNYQGDTPLRDDIEKFWFNEISKEISQARKEGREEGIRWATLQVNKNTEGMLEELTKDNE